MPFPCKAEVKTQHPGKWAQELSSLKTWEGNLFSRDLLEIQLEVWASMHLSSLLFWFREPVFLNPCQGLVSYPQYKLLDKDLTLNLSTAQAIARHTHWLQTSFLPLAIIFTMLNYRLFYFHDLLQNISPSNIDTRRRKSQVYGSTGKEIRAYFNFWKLSLCSGFVSLTQCCLDRTS